MEVPWSTEPLMISTPKEKPSRSDFKASNRIHEFPKNFGIQYYRWITNCWDNCRSSWWEKRQTIPIP